MTPVVWSETSRRDLRRIREFLEPKDPDIAAAALLAIERASWRLEEHPQIGPPLGTGRRRKLSVTEYQYILVYRAERQRVTILRVHHGSENWLSP